MKRSESPIANGIDFDAHSFYQIFEHFDVF
jgi:hypothetical protein